MLRYTTEDKAIRLLDKAYEAANREISNSRHWLIKASPACVTADITELNVDVTERDEANRITLRLNIMVMYSWGMAGVTLFITSDDTGKEMACPFEQQEEVAQTIWSFVKERQKRIIQRRFKEIQNWQKQTYKNYGKD